MIDQNSEDNQIDEQLKQAIENTIIEIAREVGILDPELFSKLYLEKYGIDELYDLIIASKTTKGSTIALIENQSHKIAQFVTQLIVYGEKIMSKDNSYRTELV